MPFNPALDLQCVIKQITGDDRLAFAVKQSFEKDRHMHFEELLVGVVESRKALVSFKKALLLLTEGSQRFIGHILQVESSELKRKWELFEAERRANPQREVATPYPPKPRASRGAVTFKMPAYLICEIIIKAISATVNIIKPTTDLALSIAILRSDLKNNHRAQRDVGYFHLEYLQPLTKQKYLYDNNH